MNFSLVGFLTTIVILLLQVEGGAEREIARIEGNNPHFSSRVLVAIADKLKPLETRYSDPEDQK